MQPNFSQVLEESLSHVDIDPGHHLPCTLRAKVWKDIGNESGTITRSRIRQARITLGLVAVQKVQHLWTAEFPMDDSIETALKYLTDNLPQAHLPNSWKVLFSKLWRHCDDLSWRYPAKQHAAMVGYGAAQVIRLAISDDYFCDCHPVDDSGEPVDPLHFDPPLCASFAYSNGTIWEQTANLAKRREFWRWWLNVASNLHSEMQNPD